MEQPNLDEYRDAIASLHLDGALVGYLAIQVKSMRAGFTLRRQERMWLLMSLLDGTRDLGEDYAPWAYASELRDGHIDWAGRSGEADYEVRWLSGDEKRTAWLRFGILDDVGSYMGPTQR